MSNTEAVQCTATHSHRAAGHPVWRKLIEFKFDDPETTLTFTRRLARENSWSPALAERVVAEYRRFLFLTQVAGHPVTPSEEVDQAWHLHLVYTRSYWEELCGKVFGQALHHGPTKGGIREGAKFEDWYERTLASYRAWFGDAPPADIWPGSALRFGKAPSYRRVSTQDFWLLPKRLLRRVVLHAAAVVGALLTTGFIAAMSTGGMIVLVAAIVFLIAIPVGMAMMGGSGRRRDDKGGNGCGGTGCGGGGSSSSSGDCGGADGGGGGGCGGGCGGGGD